MTHDRLRIGSASLRIDGGSCRKAARTRSAGISLAAHPERSGGAGDKQAVSGRRRRALAVGPSAACCLLSARPGAGAGRPAAGLTVPAGGRRALWRRAVGVAQRARDGRSPPCRAGGAVLSGSWSLNDAPEKPAERGFCEETWGRFDSEKRKSRLKGSEAAEGEGAAKMASASSGPAAAGFSSLDAGVPAGTAGEPGGPRAAGRESWGGSRGDAWERGARSRGVRVVGPNRLDNWGAPEEFGGKDGCY